MQYSYEWYVYNQTSMCQNWRLKWGNGVRNSDPYEEWDDGNTFDYDGWSHKWVVELGYICNGGTASTPDNWIENQFMPKATLQVLSNNNLLLKFNDTIASTAITENDIYIAIYGSLSYYNFSWTATFQNSSTILVNMNINSIITGNGEDIYVEFPYSNNLKSIYSHRQTNPDIVLKGALNEIKSTQSSSSIGQTTLYIYLFSVLITVVSSFGGNSMELMWVFTNTLQLIYYISVINVNFPDIVNFFFPYVQIWNANNPYLSDASYLIFPESKFSDFSEGNNIGHTSFYVNCSDKIPWLIPVIFLFIFVKLTDYWKPKENQKKLKYFLKLVGKLKYDFFLRISIELELEVAFNAIVNIYFVSRYIIFYSTTFYRCTMWFHLYLQSYLSFSDLHQWCLQLILFTPGGKFLKNHLTNLRISLVCFEKFVSEMK